MMYHSNVPFLNTIVILSFLLIPGCTGNEKIETLADQFADVECKAINLRNTRFELASAIRSFETDTTGIGKRQLDSLELLAEITTKESLILADSIKSRLENIFEHQLKTSEERRSFNEMLKVKVEAKKCITVANDK